MGLRVSSHLISSKDVPGMWSLVLFMSGCNFRCRHCHNWKLVLGEEIETISKREVLYEVSNNPVIDAVVLSGGEPTVSNTDKLRSLILSIKDRNPEVKIRVDTNGYLPEVLKELRDVVNGFAIDIKAPLKDKKKYEFTAGREVDLSRIEESIHIADGMPLTIFRTPNYPWLTEEDISSIEDFTDSLSSPWFLNEFFEVPSCPFNT